MLWFGLHRRLRGALVGHLAGFEMTSSVPNRRYGNGFRRLGYGLEVTDFYDEHVEADAVHESIAAWDLADALAHAEPQLGADILFGVQALLALEARWATHLLDAWRRGDSSLAAPLHAGSSRSTPDVPNGAELLLRPPAADDQPQRGAADELTAYLRRVVHWCDDVIVVDGSPRSRLRANALRWHGLVRPCRSQPCARLVVGKGPGRAHRRRPGPL